jgi:hypothetical protein
MATIETSKAGYVIGQSSTSFSTARQNGSSVVSAPTTNQSEAISYTATSGRGSLTFNMRRTFLYFDTTAITGTVSAASLDIAGVTNNSAEVIVLESTAFGGNGGTALATSDFWSTIDYSTTYSSIYSSWGASNTISLNSTAESAMQTNNAFICAIVEYYRDYSNSAGVAVATKTNGIAFGDKITITYTETGAGPTLKLNSVDSTNISKWDGTSWGSISKINGIS